MSSAVSEKFVAAYQTTPPSLLRPTWWCERFSFFFCYDPARQKKKSFCTKTVLGKRKRKECLKQNTSLLNAEKKKERWNWIIHKKETTICLYWNSSLFLLFSFLIFRKSTCGFLFFFVTCTLLTCWFYLLTLTPVDTLNHLQRQTKKKKNLHLLLSQVPQLWLHSSLFFKEDFCKYFCTIHINKSHCDVGPRSNEAKKSVWPTAQRVGLLILYLKADVPVACGTFLFSSYFSTL